MNEIDKIFEICQNSSNQMVLARIKIDVDATPIDTLLSKDSLRLGKPPVDVIELLEAADWPLAIIAKAIAVYPSKPPTEPRSFGETVKGIASAQRFEALLQSTQDWALDQLDWWIRLAKKENRKVDYVTLLSDLSLWDEEQGEKRKLQWAMDFHSR